MGRSAHDGVSDGTWSVMAEKWLQERDEARAELAKARRRVAELEAELLAERARRENAETMRAVAEAFHDVAVKERDALRRLGVSVAP